MAKYYIQSGNIRTVINADDAEKAALWVVHQTLQQVVPVYEDQEATPDAKAQLAAEQGVLILGKELRVSEIGFDRQDGNCLDTFELLANWHQLMIALERLCARLSQPQSATYPTSSPA